MRASQTVTSIARYEAKLLLRSWGFRIFSGLAVAVLALVVISIVLPAFSAFYFSRALSGALPVVVMKLLNVLQGVMAVFLASEFLKRDRRLDTSQVVFSQSFSNGQYIFGKFLGIFAAFLILDGAVFLVTAVIHVFFARTPSSGAATLLAFGLIGVPTLVFMIGLTMFLGTLVRNQAVVYLLALSYAMMSLVVAGPRFSFVFDLFAFHTPVFRSEFIGLGNLPQVLLLRGGYLAMGLALVLGSSLLMKRLGQSAGWSRILGFLALALAGTATIFGAVYLGGISGARRFRQDIRTESRRLAGEAPLTLETCDIRLTHEGDSISAEADLALVNDGGESLGIVVLNLNPGLEISGIRGDSGPLSFRQTRHLVEIDVPDTVPPGGRFRISVSYGGGIDERYCYLDVDADKLETPLKIWLLTIPKRYAVVGPDFVHLTPECGWYPRPGLPQSLLFPERVKQDFSRYTLTVEAAPHLTAVSQGIPEESGEAEKTWTFRPETPLPQISLTLGRYEKKSFEVDGVTYSLLILEGHDRFTPIFNEIGPDLPILIKTLRDSYEVGLGLAYPYEKLSLVEVPLQVVAYDRLWTTAQESVQPQLVFLPEMGVLTPGAEFRMGRGPGRGQMGGGGRQMGQELTPVQIQRQLFLRFVQPNLLGTQAPAVGPLQQRGLLGIRVESNSEARFGIFPNFASFTTAVDTPAWPLLGYALETYLKEQANPQAQMATRAMVQGLLGQEDSNAYLLDHSLAEVLADPHPGTRPVSTILKEKAEYLVLLIRSKLGAEDFDERLAGLFKDHKFRPVRREDIAGWVADMGTLDLDKTISTWYEEKGLPGFLIDDTQGYQVVDGERTRFQVKFRVSNPTDLEGVLLLNFVTRGAMRGRAAGGASGEDRAVHVPPRTVKDVGIVLDEVAIMTTVDTALSRNLPSAFTLAFSNREAPPDAVPFEGETARPYIPAERGAGGEYIVDNEDPGFEQPAPGKANWLRRFVRGLFVSQEAADDPAAIPALVRPPDEWEPLIMQNFYGGFVRSALLIKAGSGSSRVSWTADLKEPGSYDIYFYNEGLGAGMGRGDFGRMAGGGGQRGGIPALGGRPQGGGQMRGRMRPGERHFIVRHEDGTEEVVVDLNDAPAGWNLIGEFRLLAGKNTIELTDMNEARYVIADAVKWVRKDR
jgi:ABC-type transport system involved in multi-copper enzyme maturation permease subunit